MLLACYLNAASPTPNAVLAYTTILSSQPYWKDDYKPKRGTISSLEGCFAARFNEVEGCANKESKTFR